MIVDDQPGFRRQLVKLLETAGLQVIAEASDISTACIMARAHHPSLIIVDVILPQVNGIEGTPKLLEASPNSKIYLISSFADYESLFQKAATEAGAKAFFLKDDLDVDLVLSWIDKE